MDPKVRLWNTRACARDSKRDVADEWTKRITISFVAQLAVVLSPV